MTEYQEVKTVFWITLLIIFSAVVLLTFLSVLVKRIVLIRRISVVCKSSGFRMEIKHLFRSLFVRKNEPDILITDLKGIYYRIFILTTFRRKVRYHFESQDEFAIYRKKVFVTRAGSRNAHVVGFSLYETRGRTLKNFTVSDKEDGSNRENVVNILLIHPIPFEVSTVEGTHLVKRFDGDKIGSFIMYSGSGFRKKLLERAE